MNTAAPKIIKAYPPNIEEIRLYLPTSAENVFAYAPNIYNPSGKEIEPHLRLHEAIHLEQQNKMGAGNWWYEYLSNPTFRLEQEVMAFGAQYAYGLKVYLRKTSDEMLSDFSELLSGEKYGNLIEKKKAESLIRHKAREYGN